MKPDQSPVKGRRQQPDGQRQDKKKAEETAMKLSSRMEMRRFVMVGRSIAVNPGRAGLVGSQSIWGGNGLLV
ncbi:MAG: hypothetical protein V2I40_09865 [Desulfobacteraceae bacterium]|nr:hypothetical protein [Desulfobacteraceae bacterium]